MATPTQHALLSASSASRWLNCTASPRYEQNFPESTSEYAEEGTLAHSFCELKALKKFTTSITPRTYTTRLNKLKNDERYQPEMEKTSDIFIECLTEFAMSYDAQPYVAAEVRVDFSDYVPEGFGTCDNVMIGGDTITITDYKHGKGVEVSAEENPQMMLYALGALKKYAPLYGASVQKVRLCICQPRIKNAPSVWETTVEELKAWGESIKPIAEKAFMGLGEFAPGEHCRFCKGKAQCKVRANVNMALYEFIDCVPEADSAPLNHADILTNAEIGDLLVRGKDLVAWYKNLEEYALKACLNGESIEGWKVVAGRSNRTFSDTDAAIQAAVATGYDEALFYDRKVKSLTEIEKFMGKAEFAEKMGPFIIKPVGKPTLAPMSEKREQYSPAVADFAGVTEPNEN